MLNDLCFEILQKCPNNCKFCSSCASMNSTNIIEYNLFKDVIDHLMLKGGIKEISISGGEPFLHKDLVNMIKLCKSYNIKTNVYTSGIIENVLKSTEINYENYTATEQWMLKQIQQQDFSSIDKQKLWEIKQAGLDKIVFDLQCAEVDTYNEIMGTKNNITNVLTSIIRAKSVGLFTEIHFIPMKSNYNEIEDILELCDIGEIDRVSILKFVPQGRGRDNKEELALSNKELGEFCSKVEVLRKKYKTEIRLGIPITKENEHLCTAGYDKFSIRYDGIVLPCVAFKEMDDTKLEAIFKKNGINFKPFSIKENLDMILPKEGNNKLPICKQIYDNINN